MACSTKSDRRIHLWGCPRRIRPYPAHARLDTWADGIGRLRQGFPVEHLTIGWTGLPGGADDGVEVGEFLRLAVGFVQVANGTEAEDPRIHGTRIRGSARWLSAAI